MSGESGSLRVVRMQDERSGFKYRLPDTNVLTTGKDLRNTVRVLGHSKRAIKFVTKGASIGRNEDTPGIVPSLHTGQTPSAHPQVLGSTGRDCPTCNLVRGPTI